MQGKRNQNQRRKRVSKMNLNKYSTKELVEELKSREGVETEYAEPHQDKTITVNGPAIILVVTD